MNKMQVKDIDLILTTPNMTWPAWVQSRRVKNTKTQRKLYRKPESLFSQTLSSATCVLSFSSQFQPFLYLCLHAQTTWKVVWSCGQLCIHCQGDSLAICSAVWAHGLFPMYVHMADFFTNILLLSPSYSLPIHDVLWVPTSFVKVVWHQSEG